MLYFYIIIWSIWFLLFSIQRSVLTIHRLSLINYNLLCSFLLPNNYNTMVNTIRIIKFSTLIFLFYENWKFGLTVFSIGLVLQWILPIPFFLFKKYFNKKHWGMYTFSPNEASEVGITISRIGKIFF